MLGYGAVSSVFFCTSMLGCVATYLMFFQIRSPGVKHGEQVAQDQQVAGGGGEGTTALNTSNTPTAVYRGILPRSTLTLAGYIRYDLLCFDEGDCLTILFALFCASMLCGLYVSMSSAFFCETLHGCMSRCL